MSVQMIDCVSTAVYLKSDSSTEVEWLIMAHRQSMLELDRALLMHFFTM